jgi:hypothetical protein
VESTGQGSPPVSLSHAKENQVAGVKMQKPFFILCVPIYAFGEIVGLRLGRHVMGAGFRRGTACFILIFGNAIGHVNVFER